jgi:Protein of unknown function (DUF1553)/Protein of unknown function (DUF1549)
MWKKNLLFLLVVVLGLGSLVAGLLRRERVHGVRDFIPQRFSEQNSTGVQWNGTLSALNQHFQTIWEQQQLQTAPRASDVTIARRLSLALTGTIPSVEEIRSMERIAPEKRVEWWVSYLLEDRRFADYIAERLARGYVGTEEGPLIFNRRSRFTNWLAEHLRKNTPYNTIVKHILQEEGIWTDSPPVNFISVTIDPENDTKLDPVKLAARTSRAFLATRIDCLQCHDDNLGTINFGTHDSKVAGEQRHFHQLAAFYSEASRTIRGISDIPGKQYETQYLNVSETEKVPAEVPYGAEYFSRNGRRREQLASWITHPENKPFARAIVNRMWALMFGKPLHDPIDNIPLTGQRHAALDFLAEDFTQHGFDLHRLIRLIAASNVFQRDSQADYEITAEHEQHWAVFPMTSLRPEQVAGALQQSASLGTIDSDAHVFWRLIKFGQTNEFVKRYGDVAQEEFIERGGTIPQRLLMMNGELVKERTEQNIVLNASMRIAILTNDNKLATEIAFLAVLTRRPTPEESEHFVRVLQERKLSRPQKMEDLYWTLINTSEFSWNH